jgi:hypothetical protein
MKTLIECWEVSGVALEEEVRLLVGRNDIASIKTCPEKSKT